ncbi:MAG TPA: ribokinase [Agriterribacter sp.]|nr:ribokinase [Agriterribacter sp.]
MTSAQQHHPTSTAGILVVGSSNTDMVIKSSRIPLPGETILGGDFLMNPGGKGANQAVAAARLGGRVAFIAKVGNDIFGEQAIAHFRNEGIDTAAVIADKEHPSGVALITVDAAGENCIVVAPGANGFLDATDILHFKNKITEAEVIVLQLEVPLPTVEQVVAIAAANHKKVILNPAPACILPAGIFKSLFLLTPNQVETEMLTGVKVNTLKDCEKAAEAFKKKGLRNCMITLGEMGVYVNAESFTGHIPSIKVEAVDTTAAGDVFTAAVAVAIAEGKSVDEAARFGVKAAAVAVTRPGAQASAPYRSEITG